MLPGTKPVLLPEHRYRSRLESGEIEINASPIMDLVATIRNSGDITSQDVLALRRAVFGDARVWPHEAEALFDL